MTANKVTPYHLGNSKRSVHYQQLSVFMPYCMQKHPVGTISGIEFK